MAITPAHIQAGAAVLQGIGAVTGGGGSKYSGPSKQALKRQFIHANKTRAANYDFFKSKGWSDHLIAGSSSAAAGGTSTATGFPQVKENRAEKLSRVARSISDVARFKVERDEAKSRQKRNEAEAMYYNAQTAKITSDAHASADRAYWESIDLKNQSVGSTIPGDALNPNPVGTRHNPRDLYTWVQTKDGDRIQVVDPHMSESFDNIVSLGLSAPDGAGSILSKQDKDNWKRYKTLTKSAFTKLWKLYQRRR